MLLTDRCLVSPDNEIPGGQAASEMELIARSLTSSTWTLPSPIRRSASRPLRVKRANTHKMDNLLGQAAPDFDGLLSSTYSPKTRLTITRETKMRWRHCLRTCSIHHNHRPAERIWSNRFSSRSLPRFVQCATQCIANFESQFGTNDLPHCFQIDIRCFIFDFGSL